ncbi:MULTISPECIES: response regulator transcription factor [unclassified Agarivorans]|uniref:winged helix-turn-helix domain-containing protein n=1 Tax=unclassified Agarivorans TaxID=2636026 RepID=UPI0010E304CA|nr:MULTISPECIES: response regulator transcription factor [unclassified Agarivorans]MDO6685555.1 response regulator transcription factor [Agarivorans sp. 3_MG-2023]MDO6715941.1 response regulator transcription factor [Agarivorans sp. 2_MG-2023]MDO6764984.1 response regulator transcription factor [Agarivorans sp. 1_MG-2023]GDY25367.1 DNA-binding response regulator [Agarivorans sp. Toyoura001]
MRILVIEDDLTTQQFLQRALTEQGYQVDVASDGQDGLFLALEHNYQLLVLDRMLPKLDGLTVLSTLRNANKTLPVLILSALDSVDERVKGLREGGDDYLVKPFALAELLVRIEILLQRQRGQAEPQSNKLQVADLSMDLLARQVWRGQQEIVLQPKEFKLLRYLMEHAGQVVTRTLLFEAVWDYDFDPQTNVIDVHVARLRKKVELDGHNPLLETVRGVGYRMVAK